MLIQVEAPTDEPVTLEAVKAHLAVDADDFDDQIAGYIAAARAHVEKITGLALMTQSWQLVLDGFCAKIELPLPPLQSVESVAYIDTNGADQTLAEADYQVAGIGAAQGGYIVPAFGQRWPATRAMPECVVVQFTAGFGDDDDSPPNSIVPDPIKQAIMEMVADLWSQRETVSPEQSYIVPIPANAKALLAPYRVWNLA